MTLRFSEFNTTSSETSSKHTLNIFDSMKLEYRKQVMAIINDKEKLKLIYGNSNFDVEELNMVLVNNEKENIFYQIHINFIKKLSKLVLRKKKTNIKDLKFQFRDDFSKNFPKCELPPSVENLSPNAIIELMENLHYYFLNTEFVFHKNEILCKKSKINLREKGAVYTPKDLADFIVNKTFSNFVSRNGIKKDLTLLDFGCGTGRFYFSALDLLSKKLGKKKKNVVLENLHAIDYDPVAVTILTISICNIVDDFSEDFFEKLSKRIVCKNALHVQDKNSPEVSGICYEKQFENVFQNGGFDIVVSNPPYLVLKGTGFKNGLKKIYEREKKRIEEEANYFRGCGFFSLSISGMLNYYRLSIECMKNISNNNGTIGVICPATLFGDISAHMLRKELFEKNDLSYIEYFPENSRLFEQVLQATTIFVLNRGSQTSIVEVKNNREGTVLKLKSKTIKKLFPKYEMPFISKIEWSILQKMDRFEKISEISLLRNRRGELDVSLYKKYITNHDTKYPLIRGNDIREYKIIENGKEFVKISEFLKQKADEFTSNDFDMVRIAGQQIANVDQKKRLKFALTKKNHVLGNSCNYITVKPPLEIDWILTQLNSCLLNWRFKITSTNNHVNNYEIDQLPIILKKPKELDHLDALSKNILVCKKFGLSLTETVYILKDYYKEIEISRKYKETSD